MGVIFYHPRHGRRGGYCRSRAVVMYQGQAVEPAA